MTPADKFKEYVETHGEETCREIYVTKLGVPESLFNTWISNSFPSLIDVMMVNLQAVKLFRSKQQGRPTSVLTLAERIRLIECLGDNPKAFMIEHSLTEQTLGKALIGFPIALMSAALLRKVSK